MEFSSSKKGQLWVLPFFLFSSWYWRHIKLLTTDRRLELKKFSVSTQAKLLAERESPTTNESESMDLRNSRFLNRADDQILEQHPYMQAHTITPLSVIMNLYQTLIEWIGLCEIQAHVPEIISYRREDRQKYIENLFFNWNWAIWF